MSTSEVLALLAVLILLGIAAVAAAAETSFTRMSRARAESLNAHHGDDDSGIVRRLVDDRIRVLSPVLLVLTSALVATVTILAVLSWRRWGITGAIVGFCAQVIVFYLFVIGGPKAKALADLDRSATRLAKVIERACTTPPLSWASTPLLRMVRSRDRVDDDVENTAVSEDELLALTELAAVDQAIDADEQEMIESTIAFGDTVARSVMLPRPDMVTVPATMLASDVMQVVVMHGYSRVPVIGEGIDDVLGVVHAKDLMAALIDGKSKEPVSTLMRHAHVIPETKHINKLMREMQAETFHLAIVVDEYGGTAGLVTLEDLIEELVGEIVDEFDVEEPMIEALASSGSIRVNGKASLSAIEDLLGARLPAGEWSTVGGLIFNTLGHVPEAGETIEVDGHRLIVERVQGRRIARVRIDMEDTGVRS